MKDAVGYLRVSTREQGRSGLGLAAQRYDIEAFWAREGLREMRAAHERCRQVGPRDNPHRTPRYFVSNLIASCTQPDTGGPFDALSGR
jgi:hypothetical protein